MTSLTVISNAILTMTTREIALLTAKDHRHVLTDARTMLKSLGIDCAGFLAQYQDASGKSNPMLILPKRETLILVSGYSVAMRARIIDRWQELEAKQAAPAALSTLDILQIAMEAEKGRLAAVAQLAIAAPKVAFVEQYVESTGLKGFRQVAKLLKIKEPVLRSFLEKEEVMYRLGGEWVAYQRHIDAGRFEVKTGSAEISGHAFNRSMFTPKGVEWLASLWAVHCLGSEAAA